MTRRHLIILMFIVVASSLVGRLIGLGNVIGDALTLGVFLGVIALLAIVLFRSWRKLRILSCYCTDCAFEMLKS